MAPGKPNPLDVIADGVDFAIDLLAGGFAIIGKGFDLFYSTLFAALDGVADWLERRRRRR